MWKWFMGWLKAYSDSQSAGLRQENDRLKLQLDGLNAEIARLRGLIPQWQSEVASPSDVVPLAGIYHDGEGVVTVDLRKLNIEGLETYPSVWIPEIPDTGSMDPAFDAENNNILIRGRTPADHDRIVKSVKLGDVVVAHDPPGDVYSPDDYYVIHRVWKMGQDEHGLYYILKGDHNAVDDGAKVRPAGICWLSVGTIY